ncbi:MAG: Rz1-like lysis system protein LysC [Rhodanobacter sp.]
MLLLAGCRTVYVDRPVEVGVPVIQPIAPAAVADCPPDYPIPDAELTVRQVIDRLHSVEAALASCRGRLAVIRETQPR